MRRIVLHGHFYQPPREEPWLELMPREPSAAPDHDWNARITRQCYAALTEARVLDDKGLLCRVVNAWAWCSFNVGPTLFRWFDEHAPAVATAIVAADHASRIRLGAGNAIAMPYHHTILPLASYRDKVTEVRWGIRDFRQRFGREPEGMWLPETAMDEETLAVLADEGIRFTVLAPHQVAVPPPHGRPGRWRDGTRELAIFCYDGSLSHDIAFGDLLRDADRWLARLDGMPAADDGGLTVQSIATDGETFGHHHEFGDLALAALIDRLERRDPQTLTNFATILAESPPTVDVTAVAPTSWSCAHGVERWRADCGCRFDANTSQAWRVPLRQGLERLAGELHRISERDWPAGNGEFWAAREAAGPELLGVEHLPVAARRLLEAERHALAMFTSCGWFFDDIGRLEPRIVMRHAARLLDFVPADDRPALEQRLLDTLATAHSFDYQKGSGLDIWHRDVLSESDGTARLAAGLAALRALAPDAAAALSVPTHLWHLDGETIVTQHRRTGLIQRWHAEADIAGVVAERVLVDSLDDGRRHVIPIDRFPGPARALLREIAAPLIVHAALGADDRERLAEGLFSSTELRACVLAGAWALIDRDGFEVADVLLHAALDLFALDEEPVPDHLRVEAFTRLAATPATPARARFAARLGLALPDTP